MLLEIQASYIVSSFENDENRLKKYLRELEKDYTKCLLNISF